MGGGGGFLGLGGASAPSAPAFVMPEPEPLVIRESETSAESKQSRDDEIKKLKQRRGMSGTILTSPLGAKDDETAVNAILGKVQ